MEFLEIVVEEIETFIQQLFFNFYKLKYLVLLNILTFPAISACSLKIYNWFRGFDSKMNLANIILLILYLNVDNDISFILFDI